MRFDLPFHGQVKIKSWFAILPVLADHEIRWLEKVTVKLYFIDWHWRKEYFIDKSEDAK